MKKTLIALSVFAGLSGVAQADTTTLYGRLGYGVTVSDPAKLGSKTALNLRDNGVRLGIKGEENLNNGLSAFYNLEFGYDFDDGAVKGKMSEIRQANLGLKGEFGQIAFGKMSTLRSQVTTKADTSMSFGGKGVAQTRAPKVVSISSDYNGVIVGVSGILDGMESGTSEIVGGKRRNVNAAEAIAKFKLNGLDAGIAYSRTSSDVDFFQADLFKNSATGSTAKTDETLGASIAHSADNYSVGFDYEHRASEGNYYALGGKYILDANNSFYAGAEVFDPSGKNSTLKKNQYNAFLGYKYNFSKRTYSWVEAAYHKDNGAEYDDNNNIWKKESGYSAVIGIRHEF